MCMLETVRSHQHETVSVCPLQMTRTVSYWWCHYCPWHVDASKNVPSALFLPAVLLARPSADEVADEAGGCMYDKMFKATGGARMGMRARASQNGKLARTEGDDNGSNAVPTEDIKSEERKRPAEANGDDEKAIDSQEATVAIKMEKPFGKKRRRKTWGEGEKDATVAKAERKRDRLAAKKVKKEDTVMAEVVVGNGVASVKDEGVGQEKAIKKKKKKRAGKEA